MSTKVSMKVDENKPYIVSFNYFVKEETDEFDFVTFDITNGQDTFSMYMNSYKAFDDFLVAIRDAIKNVNYYKTQ